MPQFFPRHTVQWSAVHEPPALRRFTLSLPLMALTAGVVLRLWRWAVLDVGSGRASWAVIGWYIGGLVILLGFVTVHLGNYTVRQWLWRAPVFAIVESAAEAAVSGLLIAAGVEPLGTERAHGHDWPSLTIEIFLFRTLSVLAFALVLAVVVQGVRFALLKHEHRDSTARKIHSDHLRQTQEMEATKGRE